MDRVASEKDLNARLKIQTRLYKQQEKLIKRMELEIKKRYQLSKKKVYGIDNEQEILQSIKRSIKQIIREKEQERI